MTYLVPTKPVLHSTTKIAGAARAANLSKSGVIWRALLPKPVLCGNTNRGRAPRPLSHSDRNIHIEPDPEKWEPVFGQDKRRVRADEARRVDPRRGDVLEHDPEKCEAVFPATNA